MTGEGAWTSTIFQIAGINEPLLSVSKLIDEGWRVVFDEEGCYMMHTRCENTIVMKRKRGVLIIDTFVERASGFSRPA